MIQMTRLIRSVVVVSSFTVIASLPLGCASDSSTSSTEKAAAQRLTLESAATASIARIKAEDPGMSKFFDSAVGYAVFPKITSGALIVGGAHGDGVLYEGGKIVGDVDVTAGSIGAQIGGQAFSEIIFFQIPQELARFKEGKFEFDAKASAVAVRAGASAAADYTKGVAVFVFAEKGLMAQAAIGGQNFDYDPR